jgi:hypothetical protein
MGLSVVKILKRGVALEVEKQMRWMEFRARDDAKSLIAR